MTGGRLVGTGFFLLSLDTELAWGGIHNAAFRYRSKMFAGTRAAIARLLRLLEAYEIHATWAVVGHLMLEACRPENGLKHPELVRPQYSWFAGDWLACDPCTDVATDPFWYAPDIVEQVLRCRVPQEIGCHGFSHVIVGDPGCSRECFDSELKASIAAAKRWRLTLRSFVFPRNSIGHLDVLAANGFTTFRGVEAGAWQQRLPAQLRKLALGAQWTLPLPPLTARPVRERGMWNIPSTHFYLHRDGAARHIPIDLRVRRALSGIKRAIETGSVFHMYSHPGNLASDPDGLLGGLEQIFERVARERTRGRLENLPMGGLAERLDLAVSPTKVEVARDSGDRI